MKRRVTFCEKLWRPLAASFTQLCCFHFSWATAPARRWDGGRRGGEADSSLRVQENLVLPALKNIYLEFNQVLLTSKLLFMGHGFCKYMGLVLGMMVLWWWTHRNIMICIDMWWSRLRTSHVLGMPILEAPTKNGRENSSQTYHTSNMRCAVKNFEMDT